MIRLITTIILAIGIVSGVWASSVSSFQWGVWVVTGLGLWEFGRLVLKPHIYERTVQWILGMALCGALLWRQNLELVLLVAIFGMFISFLLVMWRADPLAEAVHRLGLILLGIFYLSVTLPFWAWLKNFPAGAPWVFLALFPACLTDTFAFLVGNSIGKKKFAPRLSPNKTWEGFFGALLGAVAGTWVVKQWFLPELAWRHWVTLSAGLWLIASLGDLAESLIKRSVGAKDASRLIPGHGGVLDRLDALIFAAPFVYGYAKFVMHAW